MDNERLVIARRYRHANNVVKTDSSLFREHIVRVQPVEVAVAEHKDSRVGPVLAVEFGDVAGEGTFGISAEVLIGCHLHAWGNEGTIVHRAYTAVQP